MVDLRCMSVCSQACLFTSIIHRKSSFIPSPIVTFKKLHWGGKPQTKTFPTFEQIFLKHIL